MSLTDAIIEVCNFTTFYKLSSSSGFTWEKVLLASDTKKTNTEGTKASMSFANDL